MMSRTAKLALGTVTIVPSLWMVVWFAYIVYGFVSDGPWKGADAMFAGMAAVVLLVVALSVFYGMHAWRNQRLSHDDRQLWTILVVVVNAFTQPVYWYLYVWRAEGSAAPAQPGQRQQLGTQ